MLHRRYPCNETVGAVRGSCLANGGAYAELEATLETNYNHEAVRRVIAESLDAYPKLQLAMVEGAKAAGGLAYLPILVDCDDETRSRRLLLERRQPEVANEEMLEWARYLRSDARRCGCEILDTSVLSLEQSISHVAGRLKGK